MVRRTGILSKLLMVIVALAVVSSLELPISPVHDSSGITEKNATLLATGTAPIFDQELPPTIYVDNGAPVTLNIAVYDADNDPIHVEWLWADGSPNGTNDTGPAMTAQPVSQTHTWNLPSEQGTGGYFVSPGKLNVTIDDGNGNFVILSRTIQVYMPINFSPDIAVAPFHQLVDPFDTANVYANASDPEGESLTWTFVVNDSYSDVCTTVFHTPSTAPNTLVWQNFSYIFGSEGNYTVTVYVSDALPPNQVFPHNLSMVVQIEAVFNRTPLCTPIFCNPSSPVIPGTLGYVDVSFYLEAYDADGDVISVFWNFDDGSSNETNISAGGTSVFEFIQIHRYTDPGQYNISIELSDGRPGHNVSEFLIISITSTNMPPEVVLFSLVAYGPPMRPPIVFVGETVPFKVNTTDPENDSIELIWDFGDGLPYVYDNVSNYVGQNVTSWVNHTFMTPGNYTIIISYTDGESGVLNHSKEYVYSYVEVRVDNVLPVADAGPNQSVLAPATVTFDGTGSHDDWGSVNCTWTFVYDSVPVTLWGPSPTFDFTLPGIYVITLNVTDHVGNYNTTTVTIEVSEVIPEFTSIFPVIVGLMAAIAYFKKRYSPVSSPRG